MLIHTLASRLWAICRDLLTLLYMLDLAKTRVGLGFHLLNPPTGYPGWIRGVPVKIHGGCDSIMVAEPYGRDGTRHIYVLSRPDD
jgi:hypothetical protein